jgi:hypothetical protein
MGQTNAPAKNRNCNASRSPLKKARHGDGVMIQFL